MGSIQEVVERTSSIIDIMSGIKLTYYDGRGNAEIIRLVLALAGKDYEDYRIKPEDMPALKPSLPYGQVTVLEYHGDTLCQSLPIARFLAKEFGLAGQTTLEQYQADEVVDGIKDTQQAIYKVHFTRDEKEKELIKRGGEHFAGSAATWAELDF